MTVYKAALRWCVWAIIWLPKPHIFLLLEMIQFVQDNNDTNDHTRFRVCILNTCFEGFLYLLDSIYGTFEILLVSPNKLHALPPIHFNDVLCLIWYAWIKDWSTYQHMWSLFWYVALVQLWRGTQYIEGTECRKGYLQVRECMPCMNEYQGRNNGWAEMSKLMLNLRRSTVQHNTHSWSSIQLNET